ncbi:uncharacterized protein EI90DRAFT_3010912 [Cantharellus anzutake]|uniref:uncharacterized protein n=1 Tax=Cantharellus anzutake TaxID=1750568 RepID=UPI00190429D9|nr:uncharacterized protein EI90DRAFT_3010912 [Cantharellus anzutake]KAF8344103.1 hypothetical protein EI90DRAFT_3010912 [Cantharellus anzutake]
MEQLQIFHQQWCRKSIRDLTALYQDAEKGIHAEHPLYGLYNKVMELALYYIFPSQGSFGLYSQRPLDPQETRAIRRSTKKEKMTIPDFILFWIEGVQPQQCLMLIEIKRHPNGWFSPPDIFEKFDDRFIATVMYEGLEEHMGDDFLVEVPAHLRQIIIQVFVGFHTYPQQEIIHHTLIIGAFFALFEFRRPAVLPPFPTFLKCILTCLPSDIHIWSNDDGPAQLGSEAVTSFASEQEAIVKGEDLLDLFYPSDDSSDEMVVSEDSKDSEAADPSYVPEDSIPFNAVMNVAGQD